MGPFTPHLVGINNITCLQGVSEEDDIVLSPPPIIFGLIGIV